ncbi:exonuclease SbcCD subunit D [Candidatus Woesearchaeota archaeon]|jgi:DNA repair protein SbcD/Mre11|nr:exonuclease SbcCD subunit D [Candidatus Woesearchaeota archaeon]
MKFAHLADCHIGGWSELKLKELGMKVFSKSIDICIERKVDFVLIAGDLFNTALPSIDLIKEVTLDLKKLKDSRIPCYIVAGSHDYSPSGKTMLDVFENAGLVKNVTQFEENNLKFITDEKTGVKLTGIFGKAGGLEKSYYESLNREYLENEKSKKIFMFHTTLTEFKPEHLAMVSSEPVAILPKGFDYYAGGHPHFIFNEVKEPYGRIAYPGALFPNNFFELEKFKHGGFFINEYDENFVKSEYVDVKLKDTISYTISLDGKDSHDVIDFVVDKIDKNEILGKILLIRMKGILNSGKLSDIDFRKLNEEFSGAFVVLRNSSKLKIKEFEELDVKEGSVEVIEEKIISEVDESDLIKGLFDVLNDEKLDGEKNLDFEMRVVKNTFEVLEIDN